ncbi:hypothetical protein ACIF6L_31760 [Kitasatospora sp. NPDC086009]|uniref:hypothetical protein n=1 Tax=unclassified Kitasatospora TaxID=2633591 RepID=UPI0037C6D784
MPVSDPATLALATTAAGYLATITVIAITAAAAPARRCEARALLTILLNRRT